MFMRWLAIDAITGMSDRNVHRLIVYMLVYLHADVHDESFSLDVGSPWSGSHQQTLLQAENDTATGVQRTR